jgi:hypothetical protein
VSEDAEGSDLLGVDTEYSIEDGGPGPRGSRMVQFRFGDAEPVLLYPGAAVAFGEALARAGYQGMGR